MGRRNGPSSDGRSRLRALQAVLDATRLTVGSPSRALSLSLALIFAVSGAALLVQPTPGQAQTLNDRLMGKKDGAKDRLLVQSKELVYDAKNDVVMANGNAQVYYQGRVLEADRVIYNQKDKRVFAEGHVRMTETDGTISHAERLELTDDFKTGFIDSLKTDTADSTHISSPRV